MNKKYQVFVSSTYKDLIEERRAVYEALLEADYIPVVMENFASPGKSQTEYIETLLNQTDYYVLIIAGKYGSTNPAGISYTEAEYEYAKKIGIPICVFSIKNVDLLAREKTEDLAETRDKLEQFRKKALSDKLAAFYNDKDELVKHVLASLQKATKETPRPGWIRADDVSTISYESSTEIDKDIENLMIYFNEFIRHDGILEQMYRGMTEKEIDYTNYWKTAKERYTKNSKAMEDLYNTCFFKVKSDELGNKLKDMIESILRAGFLAEKYHLQYTRYRCTGDGSFINEDYYVEYEKLMKQIRNDYFDIGEILKQGSR